MFRGAGKWLYRNSLVPTVSRLNAKLSCWLYCYNKQTDMRVAKMSNYSFMVIFAQRFQPFTFLPVNTKSFHGVKVYYMYRNACSVYYFSSLRSFLLVWSDNTISEGSEVDVFILFSLAFYFQKRSEQQCEELIKKLWSYRARDRERKTETDYLRQRVRDRERCMIALGSSPRGQTSSWVLLLIANFIECEFTSRGTLGW